MASKREPGRRKERPGREVCPTLGSACFVVATRAMHSTVAQSQSQNPELLIASGLVAVAYVVGAAAFLAQFL